MHVYHVQHVSIKSSNESNINITQEIKHFKYILFVRLIIILYVIDIMCNRIFYMFLISIVAFGFALLNSFFISFFYFPYCMQKMLRLYSIQSFFSSLFCIVCSILYTCIYYLL